MNRQFIHVLSRLLPEGLYDRIQSRAWTAVPLRGHLAPELGLFLIPCWIRDHTIDLLNVQLTQPDAKQQTPQQDLPLRARPPPHQSPKEPVHPVLFQQGRLRSNLTSCAYGCPYANGV